MNHCGKMRHEFPPGSLEARSRGCRCPMLDNEFGRGYMGIEGVYVTTSLCEMHWDAEAPERTSSGRACAGCGGASGDGLEDVSLIVGTGADTPRRIIWEHSLCRLCLGLLLSRNMKQYCPIGCNEKHGKDTTK